MPRSRCPASAVIKLVLPHPGGPCSRMPRLTIIVIIVLVMIMIMMIDDNDHMMTLIIRAALFSISHYLEEG